MAGSKRALSPGTAGTTPPAKRFVKLRSGVFQSFDHDGIWLKLKISPEEDFEWLQNINVTAYHGEPPQASEKSTKKKSKEELMPRGLLNAIRRGGLQTTIEGMLGGSNGAQDEYNSARNAATTEADHSEDGVDDDDEVMEDEHEDDLYHDYDEKDPFHGDDEDSDSDAGLECIGRVVARLIKRHEIRATFWRDMEEPSQDTSALGFRVFDRYGCLREEFITGSKKGSGIWSHDFDVGNLLQIENIHVNLAYRRRGLAHLMLQILIDSAKDSDKHFRYAVAWPTFINYNASRDLPDEQFKKLRDEGENNAVALFRKSDFRRIGTTEWFGLAVKTDHASHKIKASEDFEPPDGNLSELEKFENSLEKKRSIREKGMATVVVSDQFQGYSEADVKQLLRLRGAKKTSDAAVLRVKYGCTCGECLGGFLSPRMAVLMQFNAEWETDMGGSTDDMFAQSDAAIDDLFMAPAAYKYLPAEAKPYMKSNKSNRAGLRAIYAHIITCLNNKLPPTIPNILDAADNASEWPPNTKNFLARAGTGGIEAVLRALFDDMKDKDLKAGGGLDIIADHDECPVEEQQFGWDMMYKDGMIFWEEMMKLKECRNDSEFGFLLGMLLGWVVGNTMDEYWG